MTLNERFKVMLDELRQQYTLTEIARGAGVDISTLSLLISHDGKRQPSLRTYQGVQDFYTQNTRHTA